MVKANQIIIFSTGDPLKISTWSNIPYLFSQALSSQGIEVEKVHLREISFFTFLYRVINKLLFLLFGISTTFDYSRSAFHFYYVKWFMERMIKKGDYDAVLILSCSYAPRKDIGIPVILFCDWTYEYYFKCFLNRTPDRCEQYSVERENKVIEQADFVFVLFPVACSFMKKRYKNNSLFYLGNVINAIQEPNANILSYKKRSKSILFVGKEHYREGLVKLLEAFSKLKKVEKGVKLDIVGMDATSFSSLPDGVNFHGYLDKGNEKERKLYYRLLSNAKVFVNPNPKWASFSATLEVMHFYTPIITTFYPEFSKTFGKKIDFGFYYREGVDDLAGLIGKVFDTKNYDALCMRSHLAVEGFSWESYAEKFIKIVSGELNASSLECELKKIGIDS